MNLLKKLSGRNVLVFNLVLLGILFGFTAAFVSLSSARSGAAQAQENLVPPVPQDALSAAENLQTAFRSISDRVLPSVVELKTVSIRRQQIPNFNGIPWEFSLATPTKGTPTKGTVKKMARTGNSAPRAWVRGLLFVR
ncbi:hypothetical protein AGMMS50230_19090 [Spirochaetia bacterium]|nr:hypothetical protein AGMMS50230_19090 [Spirochaetia bacterium]